MKVICLTGSELRHDYFIAYVESILSVELVVREKKFRTIKSCNDEINKFHLSFIKKQEKYFHKIKIKSKNILNVDAGEINSGVVVKSVKKIDPNIILVFGTSLLKGEILLLPRTQILNIHTGIVQLFRGVDSAFWSLYNNNPEGIGVTIHEVDSTIDFGKVVLQKRVDISLFDDVHDLFFKSVILGFELLKEVLYLIEHDRLRLKSVQIKGKLYQNIDMSIEAIRYVEKNTHSILSMYLDRKYKHDKDFPIYS